MKIKTKKVAKNALELINSIDINKYSEHAGLSVDETRFLIRDLIEYTNLVLLSGPTSALKNGIEVTKTNKGYTIAMI